MKKPFIATLAMLAVTAMAQQLYYIRLKSATGGFDIENISKLAVENPFGPGKVTLTGNPVQIFWRDAGGSLTANSIVGETALDEKSRSYYLKSADMSGKATAVFDSDEAYAYLAQRIKESGQPVPPQNPEKGRLSFTADSYHYTGNFDLGTITFSESFHGTWVDRSVQPVAANGKTVNRIVDQTMDVRGGIGSLEIYTHVVADTSPVRQGFVTGTPVLSYTKQSTLDGKPEPGTNVTGKADRIDIDFVSKVHTVTLTGHVEVNGEADGYTGSASGTKAVLTFGPTNELQTIYMEGSPTVSTIKPSKSGGSGH